MASVQSKNFSRMRTAKWALAASALLVFAAGPVLAQGEQNQAQNAGAKSGTEETKMGHVPPILVIYKEDVKAGRVQTHDDLEANFARTYSKMPGAQYYLAMNSISGPNESWFMQPYSSLQDIEKEYQASDHAPTQIKTSLRQIVGGESENLANQQAITTMYREDLSYNASAAHMPNARYVEVVTYRVAPGHDADFAEAAKMVRAAHEKASQPMEWATYQVFAGAPSGTYYVFRALDSLAKADPTNNTMMQAVDQALGQDGMKRLMQLVADGHITREVNFFAFNPKTSYAPPEFAAADPFWARPTQMAQVGTSGKGKSSVAKTQATKKEKR